MAGKTLQLTRPFKSVQKRHVSGSTEPNENHLGGNGLAVKQQSLNLIRLRGRMTESGPRHVNERSACLESLKLRSRKKRCLIYWSSRPKHQPAKTQLNSSKSRFEQEPAPEEGCRAEKLNKVGMKGLDVRGRRELNFITAV